MLSQCANPACAKPLVYLRDGRIFVFDVPARNGSSDSRRTPRLEHFWLCGQCARTMRLVQQGTAVEIIHKPARETYLTTTSIRWSGSEMILPRARKTSAG